MVRVSSDTLVMNITKITSDLNNIFLYDASSSVTIIIIYSNI